MADERLWGILAFGLGVLLLMRTKSTPIPVSVAQPYSQYDVDNVARMLFVETGFRRDPEEMAQIVWVAIGRSEEYGQAIGDVVAPDASPTWYGRISERSRGVWDAAPTYSNFNDARWFVEGILKGSHYPNLIGNKTHFLHPGGMPGCSEPAGQVCGASGNRICVETHGWGKRCLPTWNVTGVQTIGGARFS